jgi:hypothetical protein
MSIKKITLIVSMFSIFAIALFIYPSLNQPVRAEQVDFAGHKNQSILFQGEKGLIKTYGHIVASSAVIAQYFGKDIVNKILAQPGCVGVRMYYGKQASGKSSVIIIGVNKYGKDMESGVLAIPTIICPPFCGA